MIDPQLSNAMLQAQSHARDGRPLDAETAYLDIMARYPRFHPAYDALGCLAFAAGNLEMAANLFRRAIDLDKDVAIYHRNLGETCRRMGRFDEAVEAGRQACRLAPLDIDAHFNLALACSDAKDFAGANCAYGRVLELQEPYLANALPRVWNMRGVALHRMERYAEARECYERALGLWPEFPEALNALGNLFGDIGLSREARDCFSRAVELAPGFAMARLSLGMTQLKLGDWQAGWENYEARWRGSAESGNGTFVRPACPLPQWNGGADTGQHGLMVISEQGYGDLFLFSRYLKLLLPRFARVALVCPEPITHRLMQWSFGRQVELLQAMPRDFTRWHWQCPLMSLPRAFQTRPDTVPCDTPYLTIPSEAREFWRARLNRAASGRFTVGLAWAGRKSHQHDKHRSLRFEQLLPLLKDERITWINLQKRAPDEAGPDIPQGIHWLDWTADLGDFGETAALVSNLDLVISVDSAMVHLAGALARPVWMLNRYAGEWRWLERREDSPWYPTLRIFNQPRWGDWAGVTDAVRRALDIIKRS